MKKIFSLSIAILFTLTFTNLATAQDTTTIPPQVPKKAEKPLPKPTPPAEDSMNSEDIEIAEEGEDYDVPMIGKTDLKGGKAKLSAEVDGLNAEAFIEANKDKTTMVRITMSNLNKVAKDKTYFVWLATGEGIYTKIGEIKYSEKETNAELKGNVPTDSFGLFITSETGTVDKPTSKTYAAFTQDAGK